MFFGKYMFNFKVRVLDLNLVDASDEEIGIDVDIMMTILIIVLFSC